MVSLTNSIGTTGCCCLVALLCPTLYDPWIAAHPTSLSLTISRNLPKFMFIALVMPSSRLILWCPPLLLPSIFPRTFPMSHLFTSNEQNTGASVSASVLPVNTQGLSPLKLTGLSPCCPRDFQESSPASQFKGINSFVFSFLYSPL